MRRARLGLCIGDREYGDRFTSCLMNHYRDQLELHMFSQKEALQENWKTLDAIVLSDDLAGENRIECEIPQIYLFDGNENVDKEVEKGVVFVDKYQEVNKIVDEILKQIGEEIKNASGGVKQKLQVLAVYSLAENEMQLPFAVTLSSILSENEKVLLLDLQENSGLSQLMGEFYSSGMEELLVMAESGKYSKSRMVSCIGHLDRTDVVYPLGNTECLCEVKNLTYQKLFQILAQEMNYTTIVLNLGSRFMGFFELLGKLIGPATQAVGLPTQLIPLLIVKMFSSSAATGLVLDIFKTCGPDSYAGMLTSILMSCTETIFYTMSVYFLAAKVTKTRYTLPGALLATLAGTVASIFLAGKM